MPDSVLREFSECAKMVERKEEGDVLIGGKFRGDWYGEEN